jgi:hypothetical protein
MAESEYSYVTKDGNNYMKLFDADSNGFYISIDRLRTPRMYWDKNPVHYIGYVIVHNRSNKSEELLITQCENIISYNQISDHRKILYLFNHAGWDYENKIPRDIDRPTYATLDDTNGYREYASLDLIPSKFREMDKTRQDGFYLIYYDLPNEINELKYCIKLDIIYDGRLFTADTTVDLVKKYYEYPLFVH